MGRLSTFCLSSVPGFARRGFVLLAFGLISACATNYQFTPYWMIHEEDFDRLIPGKTTKEQVLKNIGIPMVQQNFPRQKEEVWEYRYLLGSATRMLAYVYFGPNGVYKYSYRILDPTYYAGGAGGVR